MEIRKVKGYRLILREPGKSDKTLWTGDQIECEQKKLDLSFEYNTEWLVVEEEDKVIKEYRPTLKGILKFVAMCGLVYICWTNGKKIYITD